MKFHELAKYLEQLEKEQSRNIKTQVLAKLFKSATGQEVSEICFLLQGRVAPLYVPLEFGLADKMLVKAIAKVLKQSAEAVQKEYKKVGDLGTVTEKLMLAGRHIKEGNASVSEIYADLKKLAQSGGAGSQEEKINLLSRLISEVGPLSARYLVRIPLGKLRLGFSDMTILDGLSYMLVGNKGQKKHLEEAYKVRPDLGVLARTVKEKGVKGLGQMLPEPGTPILMARANRLTSAEEIILKIGRSAIEYKYDGLRLQVHKKGRQVWLYSRNLEEMTNMFPDIKAAVLKQVTADEVIFEGEVVAYNPQSHVFMPFQETMQRKRKYDIETKAAEIPVILFAFELLFCQGKNYINQPYEERKKKLKQILRGGKVIEYAQEEIVTDSQSIEKIFDASVTKHFEGIIAKKLSGVYEAGMRGWNWIKYKKAMDMKLVDTLDVLVMGYTKGQGKRTSFGVGQFLTGAYNEKTGKFLTVTKIGTGLTDEQFREFYKRVQKLHTAAKPQEYEVDKLLHPDIWLKPKLVVEVSCDEITRSAVHTAGRVMQPSKSGKAFEVKTPGFALRFPRLVRFRDDKRPEDATTIKEVEQIFDLQKRHQIK